MGYCVMPLCCPQPEPIAYQIPSVDRHHFVGVGDVWISTATNRARASRAATFYRTGVQRAEYGVIDLSGAVRV
jgi:hypothetical protein